MGMIAAAVGRQYPPTASYLVGREKVREFARAVLAKSVLSFDVDAARAAGYPDLVAPPTFAIVIQVHALDQLSTDSELAVDFSRTLHGEQRFRYARPIVAGDELTAIMTITDIKPRGIHSLMSTESVVVDAAGGHVVTAITTTLIRSDE